VRPASALTGDDVAGILIGSAGIAITWFASIAVLGEPPILRQTLIAITRCDVSFARTLTGYHVATLIVDGTQGVTGTSCNCKNSFLYVFSETSNFHYRERIQCQINSLSRIQSL